MAEACRGGQEDGAGCISAVNALIAEEQQQEEGEKVCSSCSSKSKSKSKSKRYRQVTFRVAARVCAGGDGWIEQ